MSHVDEGLLHAWLDGELDERRSGELEEHVAICARCDGLLEEAIRDHARAGDLMIAAEVEALDAPAWEELERRAQDAARAAETGEGADAAQATERPPSLLVPGLAWAATLVLAFFLGWQASQRSAVGGADLAFEARRAPAAAGPEHELRERLADGEMPPPATDPAAAAAADDAADEAAAGASAPVLGQAPTPTAEPPPQGVRSAEQQAERARQEAEEQAGLQAEPQRLAAAAAPAMGRLARYDGVATTEPAFRGILPSQAAVWLGVEPLRLPGADLRSVAVGPADAAFGASGRPVVRAVYDDTAGDAPIVLLQQSLAGPFEARLPPRPEQIVEIEPQPRLAVADRESRRRPEGGGGRGLDAVVTFPPGLDNAVLTVRLDGSRALRWSDPRGYLVILEAPLSEARLRELAATLQ